jgi:hypothetical protein
MTLRAESTADKAEKAHGNTHPLSASSASECTSCGISICLVFKAQTGFFRFFRFFRRLMAIREVRLHSVCLFFLDIPS